MGLPFTKSSMQKLPLGIQHFPTLRRENYLYVDKTALLPELVKYGKYLFLARPRRFGKSLLISTLKAWFSDNYELFDGLAVNQKAVRPTKRPVIKIDYSTVDYGKDVVAFEESLFYKLEDHALEYGVEITRKGIKSQLAELVTKLYRKTGEKVVLLIDEYDKPIIDFLNQPAQAEQNKNVLGQFYGVLKSLDPYLHFVFITGVSRFSKVSVFSGMNNLLDITLVEQFATITGFTEKELHANFSTYLELLQRKEGNTKSELVQRVRAMYNGYSWYPDHKVYNPYSILNLCKEQRFSNFWFSTGTPTFLIEEIKKAQLTPADIAQVQLTDSSFSAYELGELDAKMLLFQTGYLTIERMENVELGYRLYHLSIPNEEVKDSLFTHLLAAFSSYAKSDIQPDVNSLRQALAQEDIVNFSTLLRRFIARIPSKLHIKAERYYQSLFYLIFSLLGLKIDLEKMTDKGIIDTVLELPNVIYIIEFKFQKTGKMETLLHRAMKQIHLKKYYESYLGGNKQVRLLAIGFIGRTLDVKTEKIQ